MGFTANIDNVIMDKTGTLKGYFEATPPPTYEDYTDRVTCDWAFLFNSDTMTDETGKEAITIGSGISETTGVFGNALYFDNSSNGVITFNTTYDPANQGTIVFWMVHPSSAVRDRPFGGSDAFELRLEADGTSLYNDCFTTGTSTSYGTVSSGTTWYHIAVQWDYTNTQTRIWVDGVAGSWETADPNGATDVGAVSITIGARTGNTDYWVGAIDEMGCFSELLDSDEINGIKNNGLKGGQ